MRPSFRKNAPRGTAFLLAALTLVAALPTPASAYIGPGAGFALISSFLVVFTTIILAIVALLLMPFRLLLRVIRRRPQAKPWIRRLIIVGLDGQDPELTERFMQEGKLPNFSRLRDMGCYRRLRTTYPSLSPTAWSSFSTGTHPAKHNIYDFLTRDPRTYLPLLYTTRPAEVGFKEGGLRIALGGAGERFETIIKGPENTLLEGSPPLELP